MAERINLNKNVFKKEDFLKTVDTSFTQLVPPTASAVPAFTVEDFFVEYENLFFEIPKEGETNSHQYLVERSGEYIAFDQVNEEIQALLEEISTLRQENLDLQQQVFDLQISAAQPKTANTTTNQIKVNPGNLQQGI